MALDIEIEFQYGGMPSIGTVICIDCDRRPIRPGGISKCQICADMVVAQRMNKEIDNLMDMAKIEIFVDESDPEVAEYIGHNSNENTLKVVTKCCNEITFFEVCDIAPDTIGTNIIRDKYGIVFSDQGEPIHVDIAQCYDKENGSGGTTK